MHLEDLERETSKTGLGRLGWGLSDQALSSLSNFLLGVAVARVLDAREFGAFGLAFATYLIGLGATRAIVSEPLTVSYSAASPPEWKRATHQATGAALAIGVLAGVLCVLVGSFASPTIRDGFVPLGVSMPGLLLQDVWRYSFFARARGRSAFLNDLIWTLLLFPTLITLVLLNHVTVVWLVAGWGGTASIAALAGAYQARLIPQPLAAMRWWRGHRKLAAPYLGEFIARNGSHQVTLYFAAAIVGLAAAGALRAGQIVFGPLNVVMTGVALFATPEGVRAAKSSPDKLLHLTALVSVGLALVGAICGFAAFLLPDAVGKEMLGASWEGAQPVIVPLAIGMCGRGIETGAYVGLRSLAASKRSYRTGVAVALLTVAGGTAGAILGGSIGAASGLAIALLIGSIIRWRSFILALRETPRPKRMVDCTSDSRARD